MITRDNRWWMTAPVLLACTLVTGCAATDAGAEPSLDAPTAEVETRADPAASPVGAEQWLEHLEQRAAGIETYRSAVRMTSRVDLLDEETIRYGKLDYASARDDRPARFAVRFDKLRMDDQIEPIDRVYRFDGRWLLDLDGDDRQATRRELVPADRAAAMDLDDGPFPLPLKLKKDRVLQRFDVATMPPSPEDPKPLTIASDAAAQPPVIHLRLTPKPGTDFEGQQLDLWFDAASALPLRAVTLQDDGDSTTLDFFEPQVNPELVMKTFDTSFPEGDGWERQTVPFE